MATLAASQNLSPADFAFLRQLVYSVSQNVLDPARDYLFEVRLSRVLRNQGMTHLEELVRHLRSRKESSLERAIAEAMTINETSFFRDGRPFELLRTDLLPKLIAARERDKRLRIWSAASSTGQEAYSIAMLLREHFPQLRAWNIQIQGTDIASAAVERATAGLYHRLEINRGLPARHVVRYFDRVGEEWGVKPEIHSMCTFRTANLCAETLPFRDPFDIVFLRNVMLYFSQDTRRTLLANVRRLMPDDGILFLGSSEQPADPSLWTAVLAGGTCHYRPKPRT